MANRRYEGTVKVTRTGGEDTKTAEVQVSHGRSVYVYIHCRGACERQCRPALCGLPHIAVFKFVHYVVLMHWDTPSRHLSLQHDLCDKAT